MASLGLSSALWGLSSLPFSYFLLLRGKEMLCTGSLLCHGHLLNRSRKPEHDVQWA